MGCRQRPAQLTKGGGCGRVLGGPPVRLPALRRSLQASRPHAPPTQSPQTCLHARAVFPPHAPNTAQHAHAPTCRHSNCEPEPAMDLCDSRRLYVHAVCRAAPVHKEAFWRRTRTMFVKQVAKSTYQQQQQQQHQHQHQQRDSAGAAAPAASTPAAAWQLRDGTAFEVDADGCGGRQQPALP